MKIACYFKEECYNEGEGEQCGNNMDKKFLHRRVSAV